MNKIQLIASDMDGTLLNSQKEISPENLYAISQLSAHDIIFAIASGRNYPELQKYLTLFSFNIPVIALNGGLVYDEHQQIIANHPFTLKTLTQLVEILTELNVYFELLDEAYFYSNSKENRLALIENLLSSSKLSTIAAVEDNRFTMTRFGEYDKTLLSQHSFYKIRIFDLHHVDLKLVTQTLRATVDCEISSSASSNIEINPPGVTKGQGILSLCQHYAILPKHVLAVGDNINDISMVDVVGEFCAMGNAHIDVLKLGDFVTDSNDNHGVAKMIQRLIDKEK